MRSDPSLTWGVPFIFYLSFFLLFSFLFFPSFIIGGGDSKRCVNEQQLFFVIRPRIALKPMCLFVRKLPVRASSEEIESNLHRLLESEANMFVHRQNIIRGRRNECISSPSSSESEFLRRFFFLLRSLINLSFFVFQVQDCASASGDWCCCH